MQRCGITRKGVPQYEKTLGHYDNNWPLWYAGFLLDKLPATQVEASTLDANKALIRRYFEEVYNQRSEATIDELVSSNYRDYGHVPPGEGPEGAKQDLRGLYSAFDEVHYTIASITAEGNYVSAYWTGSLRHIGTFFGVPATGKYITYSGMSFYRIENGKIVETRNVQDVATVFQQMGALSLPGLQLPIAE